MHPRTRKSREPTSCSKKARLRSKKRRVSTRRISSVARLLIVHPDARTSRGRLRLDRRRDFLPQSDKGLVAEISGLVLGVVHKRVHGRLRNRPLERADTSVSGKTRMAASASRNGVELVDAIRLDHTVEAPGLQIQIGIQHHPLAVANGSSRSAGIVGCVTC